MAEDSRRGGGAIPDVQDWSFIFLLFSSSRAPVFRSANRIYSMLKTESGKINIYNHL